MNGAGVCAVVVSHQAERLLGPCLVALTACLERHAGPTRLVVVDNGSTDRSVEIVRERFPGVDVIELKANRGFATAVNAGIAFSDEEWLLLVNSDMTLAGDALVELLEAGAAAPDVGAVGAQIRFASNPDVINSAGIEVDVLGVAADRLLGSPAEASEDGPVEVFGVSAGAALYRRAMLEDIGGFDGSFFLYLEDVDVAWRARASGWRAVYAPQALALHEHSATSRHGSAFKHFHVGHSRVRLLAKNAATGQLLRHGPRMVVHDLAHVAYVAARQRTLAPLRGRLAGLREWRRYRGAGRIDAGNVPFAPAIGLRAALERNRMWTRYSRDASLSTGSRSSTSAAKVSAPRSTA